MTERRLLFEISKAKNEAIWARRVTQCNIRASTLNQTMSTLIFYILDLKQTYDRSFPSSLLGNNALLLPLWPKNG
jgi:hypothetical protein